MAYQSEIEKLEQRFREKPEQWFAALADAYRKAGEVERALDVVRAGLEKRPNYTSGHIVLGRCLLDEANDPEAAIAFQRVLELDAENIIALKSLSEIADREGNPPAAKLWLERLLDVDPMNDEARTALEMLEAQGVVAEAPRAPAPSPAPPAPEPTPQAVPAVGETPELGTVELDDEPVEVVDVESPDAALDEEATQPTRAVDLPPEDEAAFVDDMELETSELAAKISDELPVPDFEADPFGAPAWEDAEPETIADVPRDFDVERASVPEGDEPGPTTEIEPITLERVSEAELEESVSEIEAEYADLEEPAGAAEPDEPTPEPAGAKSPEAPAPEAPIWADEEVVDVSSVETLDVTPFDEELAWGAGERISREITEEDLVEAEQLHEDQLAAAAQYLPGLEQAEVPDLGRQEPAPDAPPEPEADEAPPPAPAAREPVAAEPAGYEVEDTEPAFDPWAPPEEEPAAPADASETAESESEEWVKQWLSESAPAAPFVEVAPREEAARLEGRAREEAEEPPESDQELPLIMPDEVEPTDEVEEPSLEPVFTETMAEVYALQGLLGEAREIYQQLLAQRPGDPELERRIAEIDAKVAPRRRDDRASKADRFAASVTGGMSLRMMLLEVANARPPDGRASVAPQSTRPEPVPEAPRRTPEEPVHGTLEAAFDADTEEASRGSAADDDLSLAAVFGEDAPAPPPPPDASPSPFADEETPRSSYDEFFGGGAAPREPATPDATESPSEDEDGDEEFRDWLEGLKS